MTLRNASRIQTSFNQSVNQSGNIFFAIFGAVALVGLLGAATMTFMKGPLTSAIKLTKLNTAENQMMVGAQVAVMSTTSQANNGDCDSDGFVEPLEWRAATTEPIPTNGGLIPTSLGISKKDPWGTEYGYCVWNHGAVTSGGTCGANMLAGTNATSYPVVAIVSAGPDKVFTTTCRTFATADANTDGDLDDAGDDPLVSKAAETDDDIIQNFTYEEATAASGGLWSLKSGDPATAVIDKNIETTGTASFQGGVLLPDKALITCDATTAGVMAMNGTAIEICDGAGNWTAITGGGGGGAGSGNGLVLTPNTSNGMNVDGNCGDVTCYGSNITFTLTNNITPAATSATLAVTLSNTTNFEKVSDSCHMQTVATGATCQITIRAKATGNVSYTGLLSVTGNNNPFATLDGVGSGFPGCNAGGATTGGYYVGCGVNGLYDLIITPSGCTGGTSNPTCAGGNDTFTTTWATAFVGGAGAISNCCSYSGLQNTVNAIAYSGSSSPIFPAVNYCSQLEYGGFDDWFLPSISEIQNYFYPNRNTVGYRSGVNYYTSSGYNLSSTGFQLYTFNVGAGTTGYYDYNGTNYVRCMRRTPAATVTPVPDRAPYTYAVYFPSSTGAVAAETRTSSTITIYGVTQPVPISVSGGTNAQYSINGGAYTSAVGTVTNGDVVSLRATSPSVGLEETVTLIAGESSYAWRVRTAGSNTIRVFMTPNTFGGNLGGSGGADYQCTNAATTAGLPGNWVAVLVASGGEALENRLPWNWTQLNNMVGATVATGLNDFLDGTISTRMNYTPTGTTPGSASYWSGLTTAGLGATNGNYYSNCSSWGTGSLGGGNIGDAASTAGGTYLNSNNVVCTNTYRLLCMEVSAQGNDTDPDAVAIVPQVLFTSGGTGTSNTVTVTGITTAVSVSIAPSSGTADIIKNGVAVGATTTTAASNDTLAFTLTGPVVMGTQNIATITIGSDSYTWWVGYADSSREAKIFVTSTTYTGGSFGSMAGADALCEARAAASTFGISSKWKAILSDATANAVDRVPWNWKTLKSLTGSTIVDDGMGDLFDGTLDAPIFVTELGGSAAGQNVWTGSTMYGVYDNAGSHTSCNNWTANVFGTYGTANNIASTWLNTGAYRINYCNNFNHRLYCIEDIDNSTVDIVPNTINIEYVVQVPVSSRQSSASVTISGLSNGATSTLSVSATGGDPKFTVNGGAEVDTASVQNGDVVIFKMDAPATGNTSNKMTITGGGSTIGYWRVWTGDTTGAVTKRIFVYQKSNWYCSFGMETADANCTSAATSAGLGGTWKALVSGYDEPNWAVNRIGYNWTTLEQTNGTDVVLAGNLWKTETTPLLAPIIRNAANNTNYLTPVFTNTDKYGKAIYQTASATCDNWTVLIYGINRYAYGTSSVTSSSWTNNATTYTGGGGGATDYFYCVEQ